MNILYVAPVASPEFCSSHGEVWASGLAGYRKVMLIADGLANRGHDVRVLSSYMLSNSVNGWREAERDDVADNLRVIYPRAFRLRPFGSILSWLQVGRTIKRIMDEFRPDAIIAYNCHVYEFLSTRSLTKLAGKIPMVLEIEDMPFARRRGRKGLKSWLDQRCWESLVERANGITAVNEAILNMLPTKSKLLLPGVICQELQDRAMSRVAAFSTSSRTLGYFGGLSEGKGVQVLLDIVPKLPTSWKLCVTGSGPLAPKFAEMAELYPDRLSFLGNVVSSKLYEAMCSCDCALVPRERVSDDGNSVFPFKVFEYLIAGTQIIACNLPRFRSIDLSFIASWDGESTSLLDSIERAEQTFREQSSAREKARRHVIQQYSPHRVADSILELLAHQSCALSGSV